MVVERRLKIGEAARAAGLTVVAVRFYESQGLLGTAQRSDGGYRLFGAMDVRRLQFIRRARGLGLALAEVRDLVRAAFDEPCSAFEPRLKHALDRRVGDVRRQIAELELLQAQLSGLQSHLAGDCRCDHPAGECSGCSLLGEDAEAVPGCVCMAPINNR